MSGAVRRTLATAGLAGLLVLTGGAAYADDPLPPDQTNTTVDCGLPVDDGGQGVAVGEPAPDGSTTVDPAPADPGTADPGKADPAPPESDTSTAGVAPDEPVDPNAVVCIASGVATGGVPEADSSGGGAVAPVAQVAEPVDTTVEATGQLPRTGPAPVLPTLAVGSWLLLIGLLAALAGRRRTTRV